jgi:hypothetical protein
MTFDQYTRWLCPKCGAAGVASWNKATYDGIDYDDDDNPPCPNIFGDNCEYCCWPFVAAYYRHDERPRAIFGPLPFESGTGCWDYEQAAMTIIEEDKDSGTELDPSQVRDSDWRGGCTNLTSPPPLISEETP